MTISITKKELKQRFLTINTGYCNLQYLLDNSNKRYHNSGIYGWNWSAYIYDSYAILSSYRNAPKNDIYISNKMLRKYNKLGKLVNEKYLMSSEWEKGEQLKEKLVYRLIKQAKIQ